MSGIALFVADNGIYPLHEKIVAILAVHGIKRAWSIRNMTFKINWSFGVLTETGKTKNSRRLEPIKLPKTFGISFMKEKILESDLFF